MKGRAAIGKPPVSACRRGQAAVEYLMTYGWAILALIIVISVLLFSGILSPNYLISEECTISSNLPCPLENFAIYDKGGKSFVTLAIQNGFQYRIDVRKMEIYSLSLQDLKYTDKASHLIDSGSPEVFGGELGASLAPNSVVKLYVNITYASCAPEVAAPGKECSDSNHTIVGRLTGKVLPEK